MRRYFLLLAVVAAAALAAAPDPWAAVVKLKSGTPIRVLKKGSMQPVIGKFDEADDERVVLVVKNEQVAIPKDQIDRLVCASIRFESVAMADLQVLRKARPRGGSAGGRVAG